MDDSSSSAGSPSNRRQIHGSDIYWSSEGLDLEEEDAEKKLAFRDIDEEDMENKLEEFKEGLGEDDSPIPASLSRQQISDVSSWAAFSNVSGYSHNSFIVNKPTAEQEQPVDQPRSRHSVQEAAEHWRHLRSETHGVSWNGLATGCFSDYFDDEVTSIRHAIGRPIDHVSTLKEGILVLHYCESESRYEPNKFRRRLLKVDEQLRFLYLMDGDIPVSNIAQSQKEGKRTTLLSWPMTDIGHIYSMGDAVHIFETLGVPQHDCMEMDEIFAIWIDPTSEAPNVEFKVPSITKLLILSANPVLVDCIRACKGFVEGTSSHMPNQKRVDDIIVQDIEPLLDPMAELFNFELSFKNTKSVRVVAVEACSCLLADLGGTRAKLEDELLPIDVERTMFVIREATNIRRAVTDSGLRINEGLPAYIANWRHIDEPWPEEINLDEFVQRTTSLQLVQALRCKGKATAIYRDATSRSVVTALKHYLDLEIEFRELYREMDDYHYEREKRALDAVPRGPPKGEPSSPEAPTGIWRCPHCGFVNRDSTECNVCDTPDTARDSIDVCETPDTAVSSKAAAASEALAGGLRDLADAAADCVELKVANVQRPSAWRSRRLRRAFREALHFEVLDVASEAIDVLQAEPDPFLLPQPGDVNAADSTFAKRPRSKKRTSNSISSCVGGRTSCSGNGKMDKQCSLQ